uniref:Uncharacterized protein n=1 Tax=Syphacia muris TaxID=451379 RepID=A0A0N5AKA5_9BILA
MNYRESLAHTDLFRYSKTLKVTCAAAAAPNQSTVPVRGYIGNQAQQIADASPVYPTSNVTKYIFSGDDGDADNRQNLEKEEEEERSGVSGVEKRKKEDTGWGQAMKK